MLVTLYTLVVLKDLGLDPASNQARKMIDRVDKRLVFKPLNNRPFLHGETEPCINGRILAMGLVFQKTETVRWRINSCASTGRWRMELRGG